jgi:hypothetical protein
MSALNPGRDEQLVFQHFSLYKGMPGRKVKTALARYRRLRMTIRNLQSNVAQNTRGADGYGLLAGLMFKGEADRAPSSLHQELHRFSGRFTV